MPTEVLSMSWFTEFPCPSTQFVKTRTSIRSRLRQLFNHGGNSAFASGVWRSVMRSSFRLVNALHRSGTAEVSTLCQNTPLKCTDKMLPAASSARKAAG